MIKSIYKHPTAFIINDETWMLTPKIGNKGRMSALTTLIQHGTGNPANTIKQEKEIKGVEIGKRNKPVPICS